MATLTTRAAIDWLSDLPRDELQLQLAFLSGFVGPEFVEAVACAKRIQHETEAAIDRALARKRLTADEARRMMENAL